MSLVIALAGRQEAVIGGDRRTIIFLNSRHQLEEELYSGKIRNDIELIDKARELNGSLRVSDGRDKVWRHGNVLVGEVSERSLQLDRRRRIYLAPGAHAIVDISGDEATITTKGKIGCIIFGNRFTQNLAKEGIKRAMGMVNENVIKSIFSEAAERTASVSKEYKVLRTDTKNPDTETAILEALREDCKEIGWRLCVPP